MTTKGDLILAAYQEIGIAAYTFDIKPEMEQVALFRLDRLVVEWESRGVFMSYPLHDGDTSTLSETVATPPGYHRALFLNLALDLSPQFGVTPSRRTETGAADAYRTLTQANRPPPLMAPNRNVVPAGQGNRYYGWTSTWPQTFLPVLPTFISVGGDSILDFY